MGSMLKILGPIPSNTNKILKNYLGKELVLTI